MLADELELLHLEVDEDARKAADDLGEAFVAGSAPGKEQAAVVRAVGDGAGGEPRVDLVDLFLVESLEVVGGELGEVGRHEWELVLDAREIGLGRKTGAVGRELDRGGLRLPAGGQRERGNDEHLFHGSPRHSVARKAISAFLSASGRSSPKRWPSFSTCAVHEL
jgi:hypothetical protein